LVSNHLVISPAATPPQQQGMRFGALGRTAAGHAEVVVQRVAMEACTRSGRLPSVKLMSSTWS
jgi:hypothetical protein